MDLAWLVVLVGLAIAVGATIFRPELFVPRCPLCARPALDGAGAGPWLFLEWDTGWHAVPCAQCLRRRRLAPSGQGVGGSNETGSVPGCAE